MLRADGYGCVTPLTPLMLRADGYGCVTALTRRADGYRCVTALTEAWCVPSLTVPALATEEVEVKATLGALEVGVNVVDTPLHL